MSSYKKYSYYKENECWYYNPDYYCDFSDLWNDTDTGLLYYSCDICGQSSGKHRAASGHCKGAGGPVEGFAPTVFVVKDKFEPFLGVQKATVVESFTTISTKPTFTDGRCNICNTQSIEAIGFMFRYERCPKCEPSVGSVVELATTKEIVVYPYGLCAGVAGQIRKNYPIAHTFEEAEKANASGEIWKATCESIRNSASTTGWSGINVKLIERIR